MKYPTIQGDAIAPCLLPYPFAAPSWVFPGTVAQNAAFLESRVREIGLCCFEIRSCLDWGEADLPAALALLHVQWHVHLPTDLDWKGGEKGAGRAAADALRLMRKLDFLKPRVAVLHLPPGSPKATAKTLDHFVQAWTGAGYPPAMLLLENTKEQPLWDLEADILTSGCGVCLDLGHLLRYNQLALLDSAPLMSRVGLTHWSAPGGGDRHRTLTELNGQERLVAERMARRVSELAGDVLPMIEVFDWPGVEASWPVLRQLYADRNN